MPKIRRRPHFPNSPGHQLSPESQAAMASPVNTKCEAAAAACVEPGFVTKARQAAAAMPRKKEGEQPSMSLCSASS